MRARRAGLLGAIALSLCVWTAHAHLGQVILRAQRYLKLDASEDDTRLVVSLTLGPSEGARVLGAADSNGDHVVSQSESDAYLAQWGEELGTDIPIEIDGVPFRATWTEGYLDPIGPVAPVALTVEITAHLPNAGREHVIVFRDHMRREVFEQTDVAFRAHDGAELVSCGPGAEPTGVLNDFGFTNQGEAPDVLTAHVLYPHRTDASPTRYAVPAGVLALVAIAVALWRRRRT